MKKSNLTGRKAVIALCNFINEYSDVPDIGINEFSETEGGEEAVIKIREFGIKADSGDSALKVLSDIENHWSVLDMGGIPLVMERIFMEQIHANEQYHGYILENDLIRVNGGYRSLKI